MSKTIKKLMLVCTIGMLMAFTNSSKSEKITDDVLIVKNNDVQVINAAVKHPNGKTHFFVGKYFHVYNTTTGKLEKMGLIGKDGWYGLPANVDAALIHPINKKAYIFKGNTYYRYDFTKKKVDKRGIVGQDGWKGLNGPFDAAIVHPTNNKAYFFKDNKYISYDLKTKKIAVKNISKDGWKGVPISLDAMVMHKNGRAYAFKDDHYYRYVFGKKVDKKAVIGTDGWRLFHQLDAVVYNDLDNNYSTRDQHFIRASYGMYTDDYDSDFITREFAHLFAQTDVVRVHKKRLGYDWYKGLQSNIDAGFLNQKEGKYYFLKRELYYRYNPKTKIIEKHGIIGKDAWIGIPINIDAAFMAGNIIYFFRDTKVFEYDILKKKRVHYGEISGRFKGVPNFIDAVVAGKYGNSIRFYKKDMVYVYDFKSGKVTRWGTSQPGLFK